MIFDLIAHLYRQRAFSRATFGPGRRAAGVCDHIRRELAEIDRAQALETEAEAAIDTNPIDTRATSEARAWHKAARQSLLLEWVDVILLALDGAWRTGAEPREIAAAIHEKQGRNELRTWPDWRTQPADMAIEHKREGEPAGGASPRLPASLDLLLDEIGAERMRQVEAEGFDSAHDDQHPRADLARAAAAYALSSAGRPSDAAKIWPWLGGFAPKDERRDLIRAAALILARIERIDGICRLVGRGGE